MLQLTSSVFNARFSNNIHLLSSVSLSQGTRAPRPPRVPSDRCLRAPLRWAVTSHTSRDIVKKCVSSPAATDALLQKAPPLGSRLCVSRHIYPLGTTHANANSRRLARQRSASFRPFHQSRLNGSRYRMRCSGEFFFQAEESGGGGWNESSKTSH